MHSGLLLELFRRLAAFAAPFVFRHEPSKSGGTATSRGTATSHAAQLVRWSPTSLSQVKPNFVEHTTNQASFGFYFVNLANIILLFGSRRLPVRQVSPRIRESGFELSLLGTAALRLRRLGTAALRLGLLGVTFGQALQENFVICGSGAEPLLRTLNGDTPAATTVRRRRLAPSGQRWVRLSGMCGWWGGLNGEGVIRCDQRSVVLHMGVEGGLTVGDERYDQRRRLEGIGLIIPVVGPRCTSAPALGGAGFALRTTTVELLPVTAGVQSFRWFF
jgi:hypothetical protein